MTIIVIGNGFDRALSLPTNYTDFLKFGDYMKWFTSEDYKFGGKTPESFGVDSKICTLIEQYSGNVADNLFENKDWIKTKCQKNFWLDYFLDKQEELNKKGKHRWVDFESEISSVVQMIEKSIDKEGDGIDGEFNNYDLECIDIFSGKYGVVFDTFRDIHNSLLKDLDNLVCLMGFYFGVFVEALEFADIPPVLDKVINSVKEVKVLSFNYTHFLENYLKKQNKKYEIDYIHGEAIADKTKAEANNMVLGEESGVGNVEFADMRKYFQRILKNTDNSYINWINRINEHYIKLIESDAHTDTIPHNKIIFFGHSMDVTDGDIIKKLILAPHTDTVVYCYAEDAYDHKDMIQKIKNVEVVINRDNLISMSGNSSLRFENVLS